MLTRRLMISTLALLPLAGRAGAEGYESQALSVPDMRANGGLIVDIRTPEEWAETGVIEGARLHSFAGPQPFIAAFGPELADGRDVILVCRSGRRSAAAAAALQGMIANRVISVEGGMRRLIDEGYQPVAP